MRRGYRWALRLGATLAVVAAAVLCLVHPTGSRSVTIPVIGRGVVTARCASPLDQTQSTRFTVSDSSWGAYTGFTTSGLIAQCKTARRKQEAAIVLLVVLAGVAAGASFIRRRRSLDQGDDQASSGHRP